MGKYLQIRVSAWTYSEDDILVAWPRLTKLVWGESDKWAPVGAKHGVVELADALPEVLKFGDEPQSVKDALKAPAERVVAARKALETALGAWKPVDANRLSDELEAALDEAEKAIPAE